MADILQDFFLSVHTSPKPEDQISDIDNFIYDVDEPDRYLTNFEITHDDVIKAIDSLSPGAAAGDDGISGRTIRKYKNELVDALVILFNNSL